ncbi:hypothetical protein EU803_03035 [Loktanella sp. IMCC34160]|uniref:hypothetical protein n=1 Tax=Loktanella sp. IMCC34160 TaxID=2510646 RepID=UPI00101D4C50|nr:hypothetical protein [Loktanella sp. IMCC34160]RYG93094.1 hypothetical protein EU803_03035 [Loktanella sp. IMCC34160]
MDPTAANGLLAMAVSGLVALLALFGIVWVFRRGPRWARILVVVVVILLVLAIIAGYLYILALARAFAGP